MPVLADTHVIIWAFQTPAKLTASMRHWLSGNETIFVSTASFWEIAIKTGIGKLQAEPDFAQLVLSSGYSLLPIDLQHIKAVHTLPRVEEHRDPFDRMLIAQAMVEGLAVLTSDAKFSAYDVAVV